MQMYLSDLSLRMEKIEKESLFYNFFYIETVILITYELQLRNPFSADKIVLIYRLY